MSQLTNHQETPTEEVYNYIQANKGNPHLMMRSYLDFVEQVHGGRVTHMDASNPTIELLEMMALGIRSAMEEDSLNLRRTYPSLASTHEDLYDHLSDWDFLNVFASPSQEKFEVFIDFNGFKRIAIRDDKERCVKIVIPKDTYLHKGDYIFTLQYPIEIRYFDLGSIQISFITDEISQFQPLETNIIPYKHIRTSNDLEFLSFVIELKQMEITRYTDTTSLGLYFDKTIPFTNQFFYARVYYQNESTLGEWKEIQTTHGRLNYDSENPTAILTVKDQELRVQLPHIYMRDAKLIGGIAIDIYTTKGKLHEVLYDDEFEINFRDIDPQKRNIHTPDALSELVRFAKPLSVLTGGKDSLSFEELRKRVVHNATGPQNLPITPNQLVLAAENQGFKIVKAVDTVSDRIYLADKALPPPRNKRIRTNVSFGINPILLKPSLLEDNRYVIKNENQYFIKPINLYRYHNGIVTMFTDKETDNYRKMEKVKLVEQANKEDLLYSPFSYLVDLTGDSVTLKAFVLDKPKLSKVNFVRMNHTLQLVVNSDKTEIFQTEKGFEIQIKVLSGNFFKQMPEEHIGIQARLHPYRDKSDVYILGSFLKDDQGERVVVDDEFILRFELESDFSLDKFNNIKLTNGKVRGGGTQSVFIPLEFELDIFICTDSITTLYKEDATVREYAPWLHGGNFVPITHEKITVTLGHYLENLWSRVRVINNQTEILYAEQDVPLVHEVDVYERDPLTGSLYVKEGGKLTKKIKHRKGDPVLDDQGQVVLKYRKGDVLPASTSSKKISFLELDMLFMDGNLYFVSDKDFITYKEELRAIVEDYVLDGLHTLNRNTLEKTHAYYYPFAKLGASLVTLAEGQQRSILSRQSPLIDIYLSKIYYNNSTLREKILQITSEVLDQHLQSGEINHSKMTESLKLQYGDLVTSFHLHGFGSKRDIYYARIEEKAKSFSLNSILELTDGNQITLKEDVNIRYFSLD